MYQSFKANKSSMCYYKSKVAYGYEFDKVKFVKALKEKIDIPVFDVVGGI